MGVDVQSRRNTEVQRHNARFAGGDGDLLGVEILDGRGLCGLPSCSINLRHLSLRQSSGQHESRRNNHANSIPRFKHLSQSSILFVVLLT
jgi:hypothetical protein